MTCLQNAGLFFGIIEGLFQCDSITARKASVNATSRATQSRGTYSLILTASAVTTLPVLSAARHPCLISSPKNNKDAPTPDPAAAQYTVLLGRTTLTGRALEAKARRTCSYGLDRGNDEEGVLQREQVHAVAWPRARDAGPEVGRMSERCDEIIGRA